MRIPDSVSTMRWLGNARTLCALSQAEIVACPPMVDPVPLAPPPAPASPPPAPAPATRVHLTLLLVQLSFGGFHVVAKAALAELPPLALAAIRVSVATPILLALAWWHDRFIPRREDLPVLALLGGLGLFT